MDAADHGPPHFSAVYGDAEASLRVAPIGLEAGRLPLALVVEWATLHEDEVLENWNRLRYGNPPHRIAPLE